MSIMKILVACGLALSIAATAGYASAAEKKVGTGVVAPKGTLVLTKKPPTVVVGGGVKGTGGKGVDLTVGECTRLGCTTQDDNKCVAVIIGSNFQISSVKKRCVCSGGSQCITEAAQ